MATLSLLALLCCLHAAAGIALPPANNNNNNGNNGNNAAPFDPSSLLMPGIALPEAPSSSSSSSSSSSRQLPVLRGQPAPAVGGAALVLEANTVANEEDDYAVAEGATMSEENVMESLINAPCSEFSRVHLSYGVQASFLCPSACLSVDVSLSLCLESL